MGQSFSVLSQSTSTPCRGIDVFSMDHDEPDSEYLLLSAERDHTAVLPNEVLALIFHSLGSGDRKRCSLVCRRWLIVEGQSRERLSLDARAPLLGVAPFLFVRFDSVSKLALRCGRHAESIGDEALGIIARGCPNLARLKLRACRELSAVGMAEIGKYCRNLQKLSCGSCAFGAHGVDAVLRGCHLLEQLSIKRLRGVNEISSPGVVSFSLRSICLKEVYNGQCFGPIIVGSPNIRTLKLFRCAGEWDDLLEKIAKSVPSLAEVHLEKLQVSDRGLFAMSSCADLEVLRLIKTPECSDAGLTAIAERCRLLRKLHIDGWKTNRIGDEGLMTVSRRCPNLQELVLIGVNPTSLSLESIATNCRNLERLALCGSETFGDEEMSCIATKCLALKKLCIKSCPVSDKGLEALAEGCPNLVKVKVKKCKDVTPNAADWLMASRGSLIVNVDNVDQIEQQEVGLSEGGMIDNDVDELAEFVDPVATIDLPSSRNGRAWYWKKIVHLARRNLFASTFRRLFHCSSNLHDP